jgi:hypothetical protein
MKTLDGIGVAKVVAQKLKLDIDQYAIRAYYEPFRWHLGASGIGHECSRYIWYQFRWCATEQPSGQKLRLFNRGHREEDRFVEFLRGIGAEVWTHDTSQPPKPDGSYPQFRMSAVGGHFGGSCDGFIALPPRYEIAKPILAEYKTNKDGRGFTDVATKGMQVAKPVHWSQVCTYGNYWQVEHCGYFIVNKNNDDLEIQIVKLDWNHGRQMITKAERIITSQVPPPKVSENPTYFTCAYCPAKQVCHNGKPPVMNCRSCINCAPVDSGEFFCSVHNGIIPRDFAPKGCPSYKAIVNG